MLEQMIEAVISKTIDTSFPHMKLPAVVYATVSPYTEVTETINGTEVRWYEYTLTIMDRFGNEDTSFPKLPGVRSKSYYEEGRRVAIAFAYGDIAPVILGEVSA